MSEVIRERIPEGGVAIEKALSDHVRCLVRLGGVRMLAWADLR